MPRIVVIVCSYSSSCCAPSPTGSLTKPKPYKCILLRLCLCIRKSIYDDDCDCLLTVCSNKGRTVPCVPSIAVTTHLIRTPRYCAAGVYITSCVPSSPCNLQTIGSPTLPTTIPSPNLQLPLNQFVCGRRNWVGPVPFMDPPTPDAARRRRPGCRTRYRRHPRSRFRLRGGGWGT